MAPTTEEFIQKIKDSNDFFFKAKLLLHLKKDRQILNKDLAKMLGIKPSYLCHILRLNRLPEMVVDSYYSKQISISHLFILSRLKDPKNIFSAFEKILKNNLTVGKTEYLVREIIYSLKSDGKYLQKKETDEKIRLIKERYPDVGIELIQSRVRSKIIIEVKGSLAKSSPLLKDFLKKLIEAPLAKD